MPFSIATPTLQEQEKFMWRGYTRADIPDVWKLFQTINRVDDNDYYETKADLENQYDDPLGDPLRDARVIRTLSGRLAAFARILTFSKPSKENVAYLACDIAPEARAQGLEQECLEWMQERATERLAEIAKANEAEEMPRALRVEFPDTAVEWLALYRGRDYRHIRSVFQMQRDLRDPIPEIAPPAEFILRTYDDDLDEPLRLARNAAFRDHWGSQQISRETWRANFTQVSDFNRDATLAIMDGERVAAYIICYDNTVDNERRGLRRGYVGNLGTRREYRGRGFASFLLAETMRRFRASGFDYLGLDVDAENLTGALRLYEGLGFKAYRTKVVLEKQVASSK